MCRHAAQLTVERVGGRKEEGQLKRGERQGETVEKGRGKVMVMGTWVTRDNMWTKEKRGRRKRRKRPKRLPSVGALKREWRRERGDVGRGGVGGVWIRSSRHATGLCVRVLWLGKGVRGSGAQVVR